MKVIISKEGKEIFQAALMKTGVFAKRSRYLPILNGILCTVTFDEIKLTGSTRQESYTYCIPIGNGITVEAEGSAVIPHSIENIVKKLKKDIHFEHQNNKLNMRSGKSKFELICMDSEEYPSVNLIEDTSSQITLDTKLFKEELAKVAFAAADQATRPILQGVLIQKKNDSLEFLCTDSHRLALMKSPMSGKETFQFVFPAKELAQSFSKLMDDSYDVMLIVNERLNTVTNSKPD